MKRPQPEKPSTALLLLAHYNQRSKGMKRVLCKDGGLGLVERESNGFADVRMLTPHNSPSCCVSLCSLSSLIEVPDSVVPLPKNAAWYAESDAFMGTVLSALAAHTKEQK